MKEKITLKQLFAKAPVDEIVEVRGWIRSLRKSKAFSFINLNDGSCQGNLQIIADQIIDDYEEVSKLGTGACVKVKGKIVASQGKGQSIEMQAQQVTIISRVTEEYPLQKKKTSLEFLREVAHLRPRTNTFGAVFRVRHALAQATHQFFSEQGFFYLNTPIITASDCEGAGELFRVTTLDADKPPLTDKGQVDFSKDYFAAPTYLTVSGQLAAESYALGLGRVFTFGPTFRSEDSNTSRHLSEFWMIEPEAAFWDLEDMADLADAYLKHLIKYAQEHCADELAFLHKTYAPDLSEQLNMVAKTELVKLSYTEAIDILLKCDKKFDYPVKWGIDLQTEHERFLAEEHIKGPVVVTDYPREIKAFYMKLNEDKKTVRAMDMLVPGVGEIIGGSQREDCADTLLTRMKECGLEPEEYKWYLDLRRMGGAPHSGFGLGFERAIMYITGMSNIRDVIAFPRTPKNAEF